MFKIYCEVWGGVTGYRTGHLTENGQEREFDTRAEAEELAEDLNAKSNRSTGTAYRYSVVEA